MDVSVDAKPSPNWGTIRTRYTPGKSPVANVPSAPTTTLVENAANTPGLIPARDVAVKDTLLGTGTFVFLA